MNEPTDNSLLHKRRLRLGALLFQLHYYMIQQETASRPAIFQHSSGRRVETSGEIVWFQEAPNADGGEQLSLPEAILRCRQAVAGQPLHQPRTADADNETTERESDTV